MKTVILCGGQGTRIGELTEGKIPKPMVRIGGRPILWHIMNIYARQGFDDFVLCGGHKVDVIKEYFLRYRLFSGDLNIEMATGKAQAVNGDVPNWNVLIADTGEATMTAGRLRRIIHYLDPDEPFFLTYGDGLANVDLKELNRFHREHGRLVTITGVAPPSRFGEIQYDEERVTALAEKPAATDRLINGGFMVMQPEFVVRYCSGDDADHTMLERAPLAKAARDGELMVFSHDGFWQCMDTPRDWEVINGLAEQGGREWLTLEK